VVKAYTELEHQEVIERQHGRGVFVRGGGRGLDPEEIEKALREGARRLALEAAQMGAERRQVLEILGEELDALGRTRASGGEQ
jgi:DNA-binding transcriptional regulator YhcF (GntR family)